MINYIWAKDIIKKYPDMNIKIYRKSKGYIWTIETHNPNIKRLKQLTNELEKAKPKNPKTKKQILELLKIEEKAIKKFNDKDLRYWEIKNRIDAYNRVLNEINEGDMFEYG